MVEDFEMIETSFEVTINSEDLKHHIDNMVDTAINKSFLNSVTLLKIHEMIDESIKEHLKEHLKGNSLKLTDEQLEEETEYRSNPKKIEEAYELVYTKRKER